MDVTFFDLVVIVITVSFGLALHHLRAEQERLTVLRRKALAEVVAMQQIHRINEAYFTARDGLRRTTNRASSED